MSVSSCAASDVAAICAGQRAALGKPSRQAASRTRQAAARTKHAAARLQADIHSPAGRRLVPRLRALVVLPTRDLAAQVFLVFAKLAPAVGLRVGLAAAAAPVAAEAAALAGAGFPGVSGPSADCPGGPAVHAAGARSGRSEGGFSPGSWAGLGPGSGMGVRQGGGGVDVLVATPGRLMAHLRGTPGVGLEHLRFLVRRQSGVIRVLGY